MIPIRFILKKLRTTKFIWLHVAFIVLLFYCLIHLVFLRLGIFFKKCMLIIRDCKNLEDALYEIHNFYRNGDRANSINDIDNNNNFNIQFTRSENNITSNRNLNNTADNTGNNSNTNSNASNDTETANIAINTNKATRFSEYSGASGPGDTSESDSANGINGASGASDSNYAIDADNNTKDAINTTTDEEDTNLRDNNSNDGNDQANSTNSDTSSDHDDENSDVASQIKSTVPRYKRSKIPIPQSSFNNNQSRSSTEKAKPIRSNSVLQEYINYQTLGGIAED